MYNNNPTGTPQAPDTKNAGKKTWPLLLILFGLFTLVNVVFFFFRKPNDAAPIQLQLSEKEQALAELEAKYQTANAQLDSLKLISPNNNDRITDLQAALEAKRADIEQNIQLKGDLAAARRQIEELIQQKDNAVLEVARLKEKVRSLDDQVVTLTNEKQVFVAEKQQYETGLNEVRTQLEEVQTAKAALTAEKKRLEASYHTQETQLDAMRFLSIHKVTVKTVGMDRKGKERESQSKRNIKQIKICFDVAKNNLLPSGTEKFYIKIVDPTGETVYREEQGSGVTTSKEDNADFRYTTTANCDYQQRDTQACGSWDVGNDTPGQGQYTVEVYHRGRSVGTTSFVIKK